MALKGYVYIVAAALLWGMLGPFSRLAFQEGVSPIEVAFWRAFMSWILFGGHAILIKEARLLRRDIPFIFLFGITGISIFYFVYLTAVNLGGAALSAVLLYTAPAWVIVLSFFIFRERITPAKILAILLTFMGVFAISLDSGANTAQGQINLPAILFGLLSGLGYSLYYIFGKYFSARYSSPNLFLYVFPAGFLGILPWVSFGPKTAMAWTAIMLIVFFCTYMPYICYYTGLKYIEAGRAAITATLEPVVTAIIAYFWWGEFFTIQSYLGSFLVLSAVILVIIEELVRNRFSEGSIKNSQTRHENP